MTVSTPDDGNKQPSDGAISRASEAVEQADGNSLTAMPTDDGEGATPAENADIQRIVELLPPEERAKMFAVMRRESMSHSGWLPTPQFMREYEEVLPGLAERIVALPEREQAFRHDATKDIVRYDYRLRSTGQGLGMAALVLLLVFCAFLAALGATGAAATVASAVIVGTVGIFVTGQIVGSKSTSKEVLEEDDD